MARMHSQNGEAPYQNTEHTIGHWLETPTAVGVGRNADETLRILAPHGVDDLLAGRVKPTPSGWRRISEYRLRVQSKNWTSRWPCITIEGLT